MRDAFAYWKSLLLPSLSLFFQLLFRCAVKANPAELRFPLSERFFPFTYLPLVPGGYFEREHDSQSDLGVCSLSSPFPFNRFLRRFLIPFCSSPF